MKELFLELTMNLKGILKQLISEVILLYKSL